MEISRQNQKAGDNSQQIQAGTVIIQNGITEQRAREIYSEMSAIAMKENTAEAEAKALDRINKLEAICIPRIEKEDAVFECFSDPAFQVLLKKVQLSAICTERENDYSILSELLVHRIKNKGNVKKKASITKAVEIIDQIDDDSLLALTVFLSMECFTPKSGNIKNGLVAISNLYGKFDLDMLPKDNMWKDNLSILGAITAGSIGSLKKFEDYFSELLSGYVCAGLKKDSEDYNKAFEMLSSCGIGKGIFEDNILLDGYARLSIPTKKAIENIPFNRVENDNGKNYIVKTLINKEQVECLNKIFDMYSKDTALISQTKDAFKNLLHTYPQIHQAIEWWNSISGTIDLTSVGRVIGHTNAKSIDPTLPDLD